VCTGRSLSGIKRPSKNTDIHYDFYICLSGAVIVDGNDHVIFEKHVPYEDVKAIISKYHVFSSIVYQDQIYLRFFKVKDLIRQLLRRPQKRKHIIRRLDALHVDEVSGFSLHFMPYQLDQAKACTDYINTCYGQTMSAFQNKCHVDVVAHDCSKGNAVHYLKDYYHLSDDEVATIGDSWNDLPMLESVDNSFTFYQSPDDLKQKCRFRVESLSQCIQTLLSAS